MKNYNYISIDLENLGPNKSEKLMEFLNVNNIKTTNPYVAISGLEAISYLDNNKDYLDEYIATYGEDEVQEALEDITFNVLQNIEYDIETYDINDWIGR